MPLLSLAFFWFLVLVVESARRQMITVDGSLLFPKKRWLAGGFKKKRVIRILKFIVLT